MLINHVFFWFSYSGIQNCETPVNYLVFVYLNYFRADIMISWGVGVVNRGFVLMVAVSELQFFPVLLLNSDHSRFL